DRGFFNYCGGRIFMGNPFSGYYIGIKERRDKNTEIWFNDVLMGEMDETTGQIVAYTAKIKT
ncbi:MAG: hypothetical protein LBB68_04285, partial [Treponema sp.]|nr:hypothetical protein [Treponema sp.]